MVEFRHKRRRFSGPQRLTLVDCITVLLLFSPRKDTDRAAAGRARGSGSAQTVMRGALWMALFSVCLLRVTGQFSRLVFFFFSPPLSLSDLVLVFVFSFILLFASFWLSVCVSTSLLPHIFLFFSWSKSYNDGVTLQRSETAKTTKSPHCASTRSAFSRKPMTDECMLTSATLQDCLSGNVRPFSQLKRHVHIAVCLRKRLSSEVSWRCLLD